MLFSTKLEIYFALLFGFVSASAYAAENPVWEIGRFNDSPVDLAQRHDGPVRFEIGKSNAASDWPGSQKTGTRYEIIFDLPEAKGAYTLKIGALIDQPRVPALKLEINGHAGTFFLHPRLSYSRSDFTFAFDPHESNSVIDVPIPPSFLKQGSNTIAISPVDVPATPPDRKEIGGFSYDALSLSRIESEGKAGSSEEVTLEPTVFYQSGPAGLTEVVDAYLRFAKPWKQGKADLEVAGKHYSASIPAGEFGEEKTEFAVAGLEKEETAKLRFNGLKKPFETTIHPARKWTIFVVPHTHLDVGYTDYQGKVAEIQPRVLTQAAQLIKEHPDFRFSMDGSWNLEQLLNTRSESKQREIIDLIRSGKMAMPAQYCNLLTGYASLETLYRSLYFSKAYSDHLKIPFEYANITDVPTYSGSYPSVLASSGVKYWVAAANNDRAPVFAYDHWNETSPFWWIGPDDQRVLFWYSRHYMQVQTLFGLPPQLDAVRESLPIYLQAYSKPTYKPDVALIYGSQVENTDLFPSTATFATDWNKAYAYPKLNYSTFPDFFHYVEEHYSKDLPTFKGDGGGYWEDGIGSDAFYAAEDRRNQNRALSAEILSRVTHSVDPDLSSPTGLLTDIWRNIVLFSEHTWLSYNSVSQPGEEESVKQLKVKDDRAAAASLEVQDLMNRSLSQLADEIHIPAHTLVVFNSLNWRRDAMVETDLLEGPRLTDLTTNQDVPLQILYTKEKYFHVRFLARDLPPVGYKCFRIEPSAGQDSASETDSQTIESPFYRLEVDAASGSLRSIFDKQLNKELVDSASPYRFGQYLYVTGGDGDTQMINPFPALPPGQLEVHPAANGKILGVKKMPWGTSIRMQSSDVNTPDIESEVLLFNDSKKIGFRYRVKKDYTEKKEGVYFAFPVAVKKPEFWYANQQGWVNPAKDLMKGGSMEWFNVQQWMAVQDSGLAVGIVPVDASLASFGDINRGKWPGVFEPKSGTIFSYVMNNYWHTNYRAGQGGDFTFSYALTSAASVDGHALSRFGWEAMRPAEVDTVVEQDKAGNPERPLPPAGANFIETSGDDVGLITWKAAEDGKGEILRLQETAGKDADVKVRFPRAEISAAKRCSGVEADGGPLPVEGGVMTVTLHPFEVATVRVQLRQNTERAAR